MLAIGVVVVMLWYFPYKNDTPSCPIPPPSPVMPNCTPPLEPATPAMRMPDALIKDWRVSDLKKGETRYVSQKDVIVALGSNKTYINSAAYTFSDKKADSVKVGYDKDGYFIEIPKGGNMQWNRTMVFDRRMNYEPVLRITQEK